MKVAESDEELRSQIKIWKQQGMRVGLVPTMGYFHEGHLSLMRESRKHADKTVVSVFVNPRQFGPEEDLDKYPRDHQRDASLAGQQGVDLLFLPPVEVMYPAGYQTTVSVPDLSRNLCGKSRPGHFDGVATVVAKLFNLICPDIAVFGEKDYQQLALIRRMVMDLNFDIEIIGHAIVRESDGLAMSSRNKYLNSQERVEALCLSKALEYAKKKVRKEKKVPAGELKAEIKAILDKSESCRVDYVEIITADSLESKSTATPGDVLALAAFFNEKVRLIDNTTL